MLIWIVFFGAFVFSQSKVRKVVSYKIISKVSIIICARNEAENLKKNLQFILNQNFTSFEVIVVNDCSEDGTATVLSEYQKMFPDLKIINLPEKNRKGKKQALMEGFRAAGSEWILLTDADCRPASAFWISEMVSYVRTEKTKIILGYAPHFERKGILSKWIDFETCFTALQYFSAAYWRIPYMGVGRNLLINHSLLDSYEKKVLSDNLSSGDDDLFVNVASDSANTEICTAENSFVFSEPKSSLNELYIQKTRHYSTGTSYKLKHQILLSLIFLSHFMFWVLFFSLCCCFPLQSIVMLVVRLISILLIWNKLLIIFGKKKLVYYVLFFDFFLTIYYLIFSPSLLLLKNKNKWK